MPDEQKILELFKEVLLSPQETTIWCNCLRNVHENRVCEAKKRAQNAAAKQATHETEAQVSTENNHGVQRRNEQLVNSQTDMCIECGNAEPCATPDDKDNVDIVWYLKSYY